MLRYIKFTFGTFQQKKLRSILTMLGIVIGIALIVTLISLGQGLKVSITQEFQQWGTDKIIITPGGEGSFFGMAQVGITLGEKDLEIISKATNIPTELLKKKKFDGRAARLGAGVTLLELNGDLKGRGLFYPPDPTEQTATIGGTIATNASGARGMVYGATRNYVKSLTVVLADGCVINIKRGDIKERNGFIDIGCKKVPVLRYEGPDIKNT